MDIPVDHGHQGADEKLKTRHSKCHDCPYRERKGVCKVCRQSDDEGGETIRRKFAKLRKEKRNEY